MKRKAVEVFVVALFYIIQVTFGRYIAIGGIKPNLLIILPVIYGFLNGKNEGMMIGFIAGCLYDFNASTLFGFSALIFTYIGYFSGFFADDYEDNFSLIPVVFLLGSNFVYGFFSYVGNFLLHNRLNVTFFVSRYIIPEMIYTVIIMLLVYRPIISINRRVGAVKV